MSNGIKPLVTRRLLKAGPCYRGSSAHLHYVSHLITLISDNADAKSALPRHITTFYMSLDAARLPGFPAPRLPGSLWIRSWAGTLKGSPGSLAPWFPGLDSSGSLAPRFPGLDSSGSLDYWLLGSWTDGHWVTNSQTQMTLTTALAFSACLGYSVSGWGPVARTLW